MNWYYIDGPKRVGPLTETEWDALVRRGAIQPETRVWNEELPSWVPWKDVPKPPGLDVELHIGSQGGELAEEDDIFTRHARRRLKGGAGGAGTLEEVAPGEAEESGEGELLLHDPAGPSPALLAELERRALEPDYEIRFGPVFRRSVALLKAHFAQLAGATLLIYGLIYIGGAMPLANVFMNFILSGVLLGGLFSLYIKRMRGIPVELGEIFSGFRPGYLRHLARKTLLSTAILTAFFLPALVAMKLVGLDLNMTSSEEIVAAVMALDVFAMLFLGLLFGGGGLLAIYFNICWLFAVPLIRDKGIPYREAMRLSRLRILQHPWRITGVLCGSALCFMVPGLLFSMLDQLVGAFVANFFALISYTLFLFCLPAVTAVLVAMYEEAFGALVIPQEEVLPGGDEGSESGEAPVDGL